MSHNLTNQQIEACYDRATERMMRGEDFDEALEDELARATRRGPGKIKDFKKDEHREEFVDDGEY